VLAFAALYLVWGSTYLAILYAIKDIPPLLMSGFRFLIAGLLLLSWCLIKKYKLPDFRSFFKNAVCGMLMLFGGTAGVAWSEQYISSSLAAIVVTSLPFWFIAFDRKQWSFYFSNKMIITGLLLGFAGVMLLLGTSHSANTNKEMIGIIVLLLGGIAWVFGSMFSKYKPAATPPLMNGTIQLLTSGFVSMMWSIFSGESKNFSFPQVHTAAWLGFFYLVVFGSLIAYLSYLWLLKEKPAAQVSSYVYVNPVVAVILGAVIAGETISNMQVLALAVILIGVLMINLPKYKVRKKQVCVG